MAATDLPEVIEYLTQFQKRVVQDAFEEATSLYWSNRAKRFEEAMARPGDYVGKATSADLEARRLRLTAIVLACRQRAAVSMYGGVV